MPLGTFIIKYCKTPAIFYKVSMIKQPIIYIKLTGIIKPFTPRGFMLCFIFLLFSICPVDLLAQTATTTNVTSNNNPSCDNENITLTATVTPNSATGTIEFFLDGVSLGPPTALVGGVRSLTISSPPTGTYSITAVYTPSNPANFSSSTSAPLTQVVNGAPSVNAITGTTSVCSGSTTTLSDATPGGVWSSNNTGVATVNASGVVTG